MRFEKWLVLWSDAGYKIIPFAPWDSVATFDETHYEPLAWWQAYNELKHDRWENKHKATVRNAVHAVGGLFLAIIHSPIMEVSLQESDWLHTDWNREIVTGTIHNQAGKQVTGATFETSLFSFAVNHGPHVSAGIYHRSTPRFFNWLKADQREPMAPL